MALRKYPHPPLIAAFLAAGGLLLAPSGAYAYIGPGAGFALVSSFLTFIVAFFAAFFTLLTFPVRVALRKIKHKKPPGNARVKKVVILGLDGLDPQICEELIGKGDMPNFSRLAIQGTFRRLGTSVPAMSPVAWSTFSTGVDASRHAIFDFLSRDPRSYAPILSSSSVAAPKRFLKILGLRIPLAKGRVRFLRKSKSFWKVLGEYGIFSSIIRVPITFPPEQFNGVMLSGMCVPDLRGSMGSFTFFTQRDADEKIGGMVIKLNKNGAKLSSNLPGPKSPVSEKILKLPLEISIDRSRRGAKIKISDQEFFVAEREFSPWIRLTFKAGTGIKLNGIARFYITSLDGDFGLYVSPIHIDPEKPAMPISHPPYYSIYLAKRRGLFGTLGLAEDTWAINERVLDEEGFIKQAYLFHRERETMFLDALRKLRKGLVVCVFDLSDRLQHIFFRYLVSDHEANAGKDTSRHREALLDMYRAMDKLLGKTLCYVDKDTALLVISDHGFKAFRRGVDLNAWLRENGYMSLRDEQPARYLENVDWMKTKAYAIGLGGIFINRKGRERLGTVEDKEAEALKQEIAAKLLTLKDPEDGGRIVNRVFDVDKDFTGPYRHEGPDLIVGFAEGYRVSWDCARGKVGNSIVEDNEKSWSGDHCMDPNVVPGIFFSNFKPQAESLNLVDIAPSVLRLFGIEPPAYMMGKDLFSSS